MTNLAPVIDSCCSRTEGASCIRSLRKKHATIMTATESTEDRLIAHLVKVAVQYLE